MEQFRFSLQSVYNLKKHTEDNEKTTLFTMKSQLAGKQSERNALNVQYRSCEAEWKESAGKGTSADKLNQIFNYFKELSGLIAAKQKEIDELLIVIERQTKIVIGVSSEVKILEKLKKKQFMRYTEEVNKENERLLEDFLNCSAEVTA